MALSKSDFLNEDISDFAQFLGLDGIDEDLFYESYYEMETECNEYREKEVHLWR